MHKPIKFSGAIPKLKILDKIEKNRIFFSRALHDKNQPPTLQ
jgi:hypothetical protein